MGIERFIGVGNNRVWWVYAKMSEYDPASLNEAAENVDVDESLTAEITEVRQDIAHNIFGDNVQSEPDKEMLVVTAETEMGDKMQEVESVFSLPESEKSWLNPLFKLARFRSKYGQVPEEGMTVGVTANDNGFLDIDIPERANIGADS